MKRIKSLPTTLRPREKLLKQGSKALTVEELYAVVLTTGTRNQPVSILAAKLAKLSGKEYSVDALRHVGLGPSKIAQVLAAIELGKRLIPEQATPLSSAEMVYAHSLEITQLEKEVLLCFYLNGRGELVKKETVAVGSLNRAHVSPSDIFGAIKYDPIASIILVHNHPSGNLDASDADVLFTKRIQKAGEILGITLLDHLIVGKSGWKQILL